MSEVRYLIFGMRRGWANFSLEDILFEPILSSAEAGSNVSKMRLNSKQALVELELEHSECRSSLSKVSSGQLGSLTASIWHLPLGSEVAPKFLQPGLSGLELCNYKLTGTMLLVL